VFQTLGGDPVDVHSINNTLGNPNLSPELHTELEFGLEGRFLNDRVGIDLSYYNKKSTDLILTLNMDPATGYTNTEVNGAEITNRGWEVQLNLVPVRGAFTWEISPNFTRNRNYVDQVFEGVSQLQIGDGIVGVANWAIPGDHYGVIQGLYYERSPNGQRLVGVQGSYNASSDILPIADPNPKWTGNLGTTLSWKGLSFYMLWSYQHGGDVFAMSVATWFARGNTKDTDLDRSLPFILPGEIENTDGTYRPNDIQVYLGDESFNAYFFADEGGIFDATTIRLREITLSYALPSSILSKTPFGNVELRASGQNLFYKGVNFPEYTNYDPDVISTGVSNSRGLEFITGPTVKRYSVGLRVTL
jgi:outer membrane receptor protein involved in Fe transport